ncbi:MAG: hypothetical protein ACEY3D_01965 [Rickettsia sp.]|uniref:hypothetical protein n=1 Tax=Rickettsia sp. TaxID=789 RepID=UPI00397BF619
MMRYLIKRNKFFLILKTNWDYIEEKIEDFKVFIRIASILSIDASEVNINRLCKSLLNNTSLLENFILDDLRKI